MIKLSIIAKKIINTLFTFRQKFKRSYYTSKAKKRAKQYGTGLKVNYKSNFGDSIYFGNNCNLNEVLPQLINTEIFITIKN